MTSVKLTGQMTSCSGGFGRNEYSPSLGLGLLQWFFIFLKGLRPMLLKPRLTMPPLGVHMQCVLYGDRGHLEGVHSFPNQWLFFYRKLNVFFASVCFLWFVNFLRINMKFNSLAF